MLGQKIGRLYASNFGDIYSFSSTQQVLNKDVFAEIALVTGSVHGEDYWYVGCGIAQIVSDSGVEAPDKPYAFRRNVTSVTFKVDGYKSQTTARYALNYWS